MPAKAATCCSGSTESLPCASGAGRILLQPARNRAAQDHVDARDKFARAERLCDVVVAADLEPQHTVDLVVAGGEEQDRDIGGFADLPADVEAVEFRHADIEHDEIGPVAGEAGQRLLAVARLEHGHAGFLERDADDLADMEVIVDDEDTVRQKLLRKMIALNPPAVCCFSCAVM